jgi:signal transduction histidine kinase
MMAITHELKTPIAVTRLNLETLQKYKLDEGRQQKIIQSALQETDRLNTLANNILVSAQLESGHYQIAAETVNLSDLILKTVTDFRNRLPDTLWDAQISPQLTVTGDALLLQILVNNLIGNALKYSPKGSVITVILKKDQENIYLKVRDQGSGIPPQEKKRVFQKFYRIGNEETRTTQGTGLGLYLCKKIATDHQATITVADNEPSGSEFTVIFHSNT